MKDLTKGSISSHLIAMAVPMAAGMIFQTLYFFVDLYFVAQLGDAAVAGVSTAGNAMFIIMAMTQVLGVGTVALIAHAVGRKDQADANLIFNQSLLIAVLCGVLTLILGYAGSLAYVRSIAADEATVQAGVTYLYWFLPGMALQFAMVAMGSALRGTGIVKPTMVVQVLTLVINTILAPILIAGWGIGRPMGVAGAGLASTIAIVVGVILLSLYFVRLEKYVSFHKEQWQPRVAVWKRMLSVGLPAGGEFALMFLFTAVTYWALRNFGAAAQAAFGIGGRIMQGIFLPVDGDRVRGRTGRRSELRRATARACARDIPRSCEALHSPDVRADAVVPMAARRAHRLLLEGTGSHRDRRAVPADHLVQLRAVRCGLHVFEHVPGARQHPALAVQLCDAIDHLQRAGHLDDDAALVHPEPHLVPVGRDGCAADDRQLRAGAEADAREAECVGCGAGARRKSG